MAIARAAVMGCQICVLKFKTFVRFSRHAVEVHGANAATMRSIGAQFPDAALVIVRTEGGRAMVMVAEPLWPDMP